jgi:L-malate glycosyltransferase
MMASLVTELAVSGRTWNAVLVPGLEGADQSLVGNVRESADHFGMVPAVPLYDPRLTAALFRQVRQLEVEVIHSHLSTANFSSRVAALGTRVPHMTTLHTMPGPSVEDTRLRVFADGWSSWISRLLVAPSDQIATAYREAFRLPPDRLRVIPNAPRWEPLPDDFDREAVRLEVAGPGVETLVLVVARLRTEKGIGDLLDAAALLRDKLPGLRVVVAGAGDAEAELRTQIAVLGLDGHVRLLGHRSDVGALLGAADIFCLPSLHEGLPVSLLEAMRSGLPCVSTRVGGIPSLVQDGVDGLLVDPGDPPGLATAIARLAADPEAGLKIGQMARRVVENDFDLARVVGTYADLYDELRGG